MNILLRELAGTPLLSLLPRLETLEIAHAAFTGMLFARLLIALPLRNSDHGRLERLTISVSNISAESFDILVALLPGCTVVWDRLEF